jgi:hypothetical protein
LIPFLLNEEDYNYSRYDNVDSVEDLPTSLYYKQLAVAYPSAKFVLTVRDEDAWFASAKDFFLGFFGGVRSFRDEVPHSNAGLLSSLLKMR